ncbi:hypothetical protein EVAR_51547_1 [Eumeta japonica]|uniref:Uncharacterized protein n=1 Tax=Eumeta variegata TaxID=151549 RepID=A0A4C1YGB9_EUMVA|nr:hypothetical protein EVAR_51547_1 [Eumeta japonica]
MQRRLSEYIRWAYRERYMHIVLDTLVERSIFVLQNASPSNISTQSTHENFCQTSELGTSSYIPNHPHSLPPHAINSQSVIRLPASRVEIGYPTEERMGQQKGSWKDERGLGVDDTEREEGGENAMHLRYTELVNMEVRKTFDRASHR